MFRDFPQRHRFSKTLLAKYTNLNNRFYMNIKFDELLSEISNVLRKGEFKLTMSA